MHSFILNFILLIHSIYDFIIEKIFAFFYRNSKKHLPAVTNSILLESAVDIATKIRRKQISSESCVRAYIEQCNLVNPYINAVVCEAYEEAIKEAQHIDLYLKNYQEDEEEIKKSKPFLGVPFTTKESSAVKGLLNTLAIKSRLNVKAEEDSDAVKFMKEAGGILICLTNIPELNMWCETRNLIYGQTNNPYDVRKNVGGSSGGESAIIAACGSPLGIGTDIGGSIRMPAFFCGIFGHKPTTGLTPMKGLTLRTGEEKDSMVSAGPMVKYAKDLAPLLRILLGSNVDQLDLDKQIPIEKIKFLYIDSNNDPRISPLSKEIKGAMHKVIDYLKSKDIYPVKVEVEELQYSFRLWRHFMTKENYDFAGLISLEPNKRANGLRELWLKLMGKERVTFAAIMRLIDEKLPKENPQWAEETKKIILSKFENLLGPNTVLLYPSSPYPANFHYTSLFNPYNFGYWAIFNVLKFPVTQIPLGLGKDGVPLGIQVAAWFYNDHLCLEVAREFEKAFGGWVPPFQTK